MTRRLLPITLTLIFLVLPPALAAAHEQGSAASSDITVSGEVLDLACYVSDGAKGPQHQACAVSCAQAGQPMGLLTAEGKIYILFADHADGSPYDKTKALAGAKAEIKGEPAEKGGLSGLTVHAVKKI
ncbi:MAG TPA: hypothetical protein VFT43_11670 [Candidatus Polarisedimenticolia bacterium]|nr:hypothetical protein [Candidatus Polarisedimenticolia bacterium]